MPAEHDVVVYGATGFTGRLVAEYLTERYSDGSTSWAMAGRSADKLTAVRDEIQAPSDTPLIVADSSDRASLDAMVEQATVIISTVGPYTLYGSELIAACAAAGTAYVDLCGEPLWMRDMIEAHQAEAEASGARIVFSCGFDSIPFDLGVWALQRQAIDRYGTPASKAKGRVRKMRGSFSGGTAASMRATLEVVARNPALAPVIASPFALTPGFTGPHQPAGLLPAFDPDVKGWVAPFVMAAINTKNVHRTNFLSDFAYGEDFVYDEMVVAPGLGEIGKQAAETIASMNPFGAADALKSGEGPSKEERDAGYYDVLFIGEVADGEKVQAVVTGDKDPGYGSTSKMLTESALCLVNDIPAEGRGGIWTPGALMAAPLIERLTQNAGLTFTAQ